MHALHTSELLDACAAAGLVLALTPDHGLKVTPAKSLTEVLRASIKANKAALVAYLESTAANDAPVGTPAARITSPTDTHPTPAADPDRWCWPHSAAMNGQEIDTFTVRLASFTDKGLSLADAERAADRLVIRDREGDDRRLCLECSHLQGHGRWRCGNWQAADVASQGLAPGLVQALQRCSGYRCATNNGA